MFGLAQAGLVRTILRASDVEMLTAAVRRVLEQRTRKERANKAGRSEKTRILVVSSNVTWHGISSAITGRGTRGRRAARRVPGTHSIGNAEDEPIHPFGKMFTVQRDSRRLKPSSSSSTMIRAQKFEFAIFIQFEFAISYSKEVLLYQVL